MKRQKTKSYIIPQINRILPLITPYTNHFNPLLVATYLGTSAPRHLGTSAGEKKNLSQAISNNEKSSHPSKLRITSQ